MEAEAIFPVFGELHADDSPVVVVPRGKPARKVYKNAAGLYLVSDGQAEQQNVEQEQETEPGPLKVSGELERDTVAALHSLAYLSAFFSALEPGRPSRACGSAWGTPMTEEVLRSYAEANRELVESFCRYMEARGMSPATIREYRASATWLIGQFGSCSIVEATHADVREFMRLGMKHGLADTTINKETFGLRCFFKFLQLGGLIRNNPMRAISYRKLKHRLPRVLLTVEEVERIIAAGRNPWERACVEVLYSTGVRVSEFCKLRLEDIAFGNGTPGTMRVIRGKGGKDRIVLFGERAAAAIREYQAWRPSVAGYLFEAPAREGSFRVVVKAWNVSFYTPDGKQHFISLGLRSAERLPTEEAAREYFRKLVAEMPEKMRPVLHPQRPYCARQILSLVHIMGRRAGVKGVHPHSFRRAFACHLLANGAGIRVVQELLGHKLLSTTCLYTHLTDHELQGIHERFHPHAKSGLGTNEKD